MVREAWLTLMPCPKDAKNSNAIAKAVAGIELLHYWHDTNNRARIVVKINMKEDVVVPYGVLVSAGIPPCARS